MKICPQLRLAANPVKSVKPSASTTSPLTTIAISLTLLTLTACSSLSTALDGDKIDYQRAAARSSNALEVPPDLITPAMAAQFSLPPGKVPLAGDTGAQSVAKKTAAVLPTVQGVQMMRNGTQRWLSVDGNPEQVWVAVKNFWASQGFSLETEDPVVGTMETNWLENRAKLPQDGIRKLLGSALDSLYDTGERDRFRTILERNAKGGTDITLSHRGMVEVVSDSKNGQTLWQPRPSDSNLETIMMQRLIQQLGSTSRVATDAPSNQQLKASLEKSGSNWLLQLNQDFDYAWRGVGLALGRTGVQIISADRSKGIITTKITPDDSQKGFFSRVFGSAADPVVQQVQVQASGSTSQVKILDANGKPESNDAGKPLLDKLLKELS